MSDVAVHYPAAVIGQGNDVYSHNLKAGELSSNADTTGGSAIPRSASYTHLPSSIHMASPGPPEQSPLKRTFSDNALSKMESNTQHRASVVSSEHPAWGGSRVNGLFRSKSRSKKDAKVALSQFTIYEPQQGNGLAELPKALIKGDTLEVERKQRSMTSSLSNLARRSSWIVGSRSPSPSKRKSLVLTKTERDEPKLLKVVVTTKNERISAETESAGLKSQTEVSKRRTTKPKRPLSAFMGKSASDGPPAVPSIPKSLSTDRLPAAMHISQEPLPLSSRPESHDRLHVSDAGTARKRDELSSQFRTLDAEYHKFVSKPGTLKTSVIRAALLPFLRTYAEHSSNRNLRAEDLDRRVNILNKWWTGLLEMLNGRHGQSVSASDRPAVLEAVTGIMMRPEWRVTVTSVSSRSEGAAYFRKSKSASSFEPGNSDFMTESVLHNTRNTFVQNLLSQMTFVVARMSQFNVPASVVTFCGKATAYAFFFCPGVAEMLVRLWSLSSTSVKNVLDAAGIPRNCNIKETTEKVVEGFPAHLRPLGFKSLSLMMRYLRNPPQVPLGSAHILWSGPWVSRWAGRDSDLFFVFVKYYNILNSEILFDNATKEERTCAPCHVLVYSQLLNVMNDTIHRTASNASASYDGPSSVAFDEVLGADSAAIPLPLLGSNATRHMAENRLIMLLREFLSGSSSLKVNAQKAFAELFVDLMKAAAQQTSLYDHNACFVLCDFLEEAISILVRYYNDLEDPVSFFDWPFWQNVFQKMNASSNSMTDVRLYAFVYSMWETIAKNEERKRAICFDWLLQEQYFQKQFNHWCPMVRAYYMRLLCWRIGRYDGEKSEVDQEIFTALFSRLKTTWGYFIHQQEKARQLGLPLLSEVACNPAPGRKLLIIRNDSTPPSPSAFLSFDGIVSVASSSQPTAYERYTSLDSIKQGMANSAGESSLSSTPGKTRWSTFRNMMPFQSSEPSKPKSKPTIPRPKTGTPERGSLPPKLTGRSSPDAPISKLPKSRPGSSHHPATPPRFVHHSFKFSLEWYDRRAAPAPERKLQPPKLPLPALVYLQSKQIDTGMPEATEPCAFNPGLAKYSGRALAEWTALVVECQNFYERRKYEGVPGIRWMETPTLGVESFRRPAG